MCGVEPAFNGPTPTRSQCYHRPHRSPPGPTNPKPEDPLNDPVVDIGKSIDQEVCRGLFVVLTVLVPMKLYQGTLEAFLCCKYWPVVDARSGCCGKNVMSIQKYSGVSSKMSSCSGGAQPNFDISRARRCTSCTSFSSLPPLVRAFRRVFAQT